MTTTRLKKKSTLGLVKSTQMKNKTILGLFTVFLFSTNFYAQSCSEVFISEYVMGNGANRAIELYNPSGASISLNGYAIDVYFNGSNSATSLSLNGLSLASHATLVAANTNADPSILALAEITDNLTMTFNGNDAIVLSKNGNIIDVIGRIGEDPGQGWFFPDSNNVFTFNRTIRRKASVTQGDQDGLDSFNPSLEWELWGFNALDDLGLYQNTCAQSPGCDIAVINNPVPFCVNDTFMPLVVENFDTNTFYTWSGPSVNTIGEFNPNDAGIGEHIVKLTYSKSGCALDSSFALLIVNTESCPPASCNWTDLVSFEFLYPPTCNGDTNGFIQLIPATGNELFTWSNGSTNNINDQLTAGTYDVNVSNNLCSVDTSFVLIDPAPFDATATITNESVSGANDGAIGVFASGGKTPYNFAITAGPITRPQQNNFLFDSLVAGTYQVTTQDSLGCSVVIDMIEILADSIDCVNSTLFANAGGDTICTPDSAILGGFPSAGGGSGSYIWSWTPSNDLNVSTSISNPLASPPVGQYYYLNVTDNNTGCQANDSVWVQIDANCATQDPCNFASLISASFFADVSCHNASDGFIVLTPANPNVTILWNDGNTQFSRDSLMAGSYIATISDDSCSIVDTFVIQQPSALALSHSQVDESAPGAFDGSITVNASGAQAPYQYELSGPVMAGPQSSNSFDSLTGGTYFVGVVDATGCRADLSVTILTDTTGFDPCANSNLFADAGPDVCTADSVVIGATPSAGGGSGSYIWSWTPVNNIDVSSSITNPTVFPSTSQYYTLQVTDQSTGCVAFDSVWVEIDANCNAPDPCLGFNASFNVEDESAAGANDGAITTTVNGGTPLFSYNWSNGATTPSLTGLASGSYAVTITDSNACVFTYTVLVGLDSSAGPCASFDIFTSATDLTASGANDGTATVNTFSGTSPFTYAWSNSGTTDVINNLAPGIYNVTVTDAAGCSETSSVEVYDFNQNPCSWTIDVTGTNETALGANDGTATATTTGGTAPFTYSWSSSSSTNASISNLSPGTYVVSVTDASGCSKIGAVTILPYAPNSINLSTYFTGVQLYPNPARDNVTINGKINASNALIEASLFDLSGRHIQNLFKETLSGEFSIEVSLQETAKGVYFIELKNNKQKMFVPLVVE